MVVVGRGAGEDLVVRHRKAGTRVAFRDEGEVDVVLVHVLPHELGLKDQTPTIAEVRDRHEELDSAGAARHETGDDRTPPQVLFHSGSLFFVLTIPTDTFRR